MKSFMMKKLFSTLLCVSLLMLCACGKVEPKETAVEKETVAGAANEQKTEAQTVTEVPTKAKIKTSPDDPYSYVVEDVAEDGVKWPVLDNYYFDRRYEYVLYDTDGKGTYALLLGEENPLGEVFEIYTIKDDVMERKLSIYGDMGLRAILIRKNGVISAGTSGEIVWYYRFEDGQLKLMAGLGMYANGGGGFRVDPTGTEKDFLFDFVPDGTEVPLRPDEYNGLINEFVGDREPAELDWKPLAEYGQ